MLLSEAATRKRRIDKALARAGWVPAVRYDPHASCDLVVFEEYPTVNDSADYALFHEGASLAIMEAKQLSPGPQKVLQQVQRYVQGLTESPFDFCGFRIPFIYSASNESIWFQDLCDPHSRSQQVRGFHTPAALREMLVTIATGSGKTLTGSELRRSA
jgi:type I restriction enzyme R subunit